MPAYIVASRDDHIVPWRSAYRSTQLLGGEISFVLGASGHIAGVVNPPAKNRRNYWTNPRLPGIGRRMARGAQRRIPEAGGRTGARGSRGMAGAWRPAAACARRARHSRLEPAPGRYVLEAPG